MAATALPVDSLSASIVNSSRASASAQNCQAEASRERPVGNFGTPRAALIPAAVGSGVLVGVELRDRENGTAAVALKLLVSPGVLLIEDDTPFGLAGIIGLGGEDDMSAETSSALPSRERESRTLDVDGFGSEAGVGIPSLLKLNGNGQLEGVCPCPSSPSATSLSNCEGVINPPFSPVRGVINLAALLFWLMGVPQILDMFHLFAKYPGVWVGCPGVLK